jgi:F-type H+-transporting ATPase subunit a
LTRSYHLHFDYIVTSGLRRSIPLRAAALLALLALAVPPAHAAEGKELDALGHALDNHYLDFLPFGKIELPRIFLVRGEDGGVHLQFFRSTGAMLESGLWRISEAEAALTDEEPTPAPGAGEPAEPGLTVIPEAAEEDVQPNYFYATLEPVAGTAIIDFSVTRHLMFALLASLILLMLFIPMGRRYRRGIGRTQAPRGTLQNLLETMVIYIRDEVAVPNLGHKADRYLPYLLTVFFFILLCNLLGLVPFGASATGNLTVTAVLALFTFVVTQFSGTRDYWMHIFWPPGVPVALKPILIPVEILGIFTKPFALAIRLFANMTAGKLVILNLIGLIFVINVLFGTGAGLASALPSVALTLFIFILKLLVSLIQAYVFTILSALFIGMATAEHEHHGHEEHEPTPHDRAVAESGPIVHENGQDVERRRVGTEAALSPF